MHAPIEQSLLTSPSLDLFHDLSRSILFKKDNKNVIYELTQKQLPAMINSSMLNARLDRGHIFEPHWHPNTSEVIFAARGALTVSVLNQLTDKLLTYKVKENQAVYVPMGWWHWIIATEHDSQLIAQFDNANPQTVFGSEVLKKTPAEVFQLTYGVNGAELAELFKPIKAPVIIGPAQSDHRELSNHGEQFGERQASMPYTPSGIKWTIGG